MRLLLATLRRSPGGAVCLLLAAGLPACSASSSPNDPTCNAGGTLTADVSNTMDDSPICDATVTVTPAGGMPQPLAPEGPSTNCSYFVTGIQPGRYTVTASKSGFNDASVTISVQAIGCSVDSPTASIAITPSK